MKLHYFTILSFLVLFTSCGSEEIIPAEITNLEIPETQIDEQILLENFPEITDTLFSDKLETVINETKKKKRKKKVYTPPTIVKQLEDSVADRKVFNIAEQTIDSLLNEADVDLSRYGSLAVSYFGDLSSKLCGENYYAENAGAIMDAITEILQYKLVDGTDIVLLIDKTGSMADDLSAVHNGLNLIQNIIKDYGNVNVSMATYGDKNWHGDIWFTISEMDDDIAKIGEFMDDYSIMGNHDTPESVNDAIIEVVDNADWTPGNNRMILVIGDAPSQVPPFSDYTSQQVVDYCHSMGVEFNLYPVIIGASQSFNDTKLLKNLEISAYPNPASNILNIDIEEQDNFSVEIFDINGKQLNVFNTYGASTTTLNVGDYPNGAYFVLVYSSNHTKHGFKKFIVAH